MLAVLLCQAQGCSRKQESVPGHPDLGVCLRPHLLSALLFALSLSILLKKHGHVPVSKPLYWFFPERSLDHSSPRGFYCCLFHSERISDNYIRVFCIPSVQCEPHENRFGSLPPPSSFFFRCVCPCVCPHAHAMRMLLICVKSVCMCRVLASMHNGMQSPEKNVRCPPPSTSFPGDSVNLDIGPVVGLTVSTLHRTFLCAQVCPASYMANRDSA